MADTKAVVTKPFWREPAGDDSRDRTGKKPTSPPLVELSPERVWQQATTQDSFLHCLNHCPGYKEGREGGKRGEKSIASWTVWKCTGYYASFFFFFGGNHVFRVSLFVGWKPDTLELRGGGCMWLWTNSYQNKKEKLMMVNMSSSGRN